MEVSWNEMKTMVDSRNISVQYIIIGSNYWIKAIDDLFSVECLLPTDESNSDTADFVTNYKPKANKPIPVQRQPFAAKSLPSGKKLYKREHGIQVAVAAGSNDIIFTVPYPWVKIIGVELMYGEKLDTVDLIILDTTTGTYSGVPNYQLNQFGFSVNVAEGEYEEQNAYDADLYQGMQIKLVYNSQSAKTIGINFNLTEVK